MQAGGQQAQADAHAHKQARGMVTVLGKCPNKLDQDRLPGQMLNFLKVRMS